MLTKERPHLARGINAVTGAVGYSVGVDPRRVDVVRSSQRADQLGDEPDVSLEAITESKSVPDPHEVEQLRGAANLLGGRAWICRLHPLVSAELDEPRLLERLNRGSLPSIVDSDHYREDLKAYVGTYLREEIQAEGLTRSIENFSRFLEVAGLTSGEQVNFTAVAADAGYPPRTVREHHQILEDTLVGHRLPAYQRTSKRKPVATAKFYLFDVGVANTLKRTPVIEEGSDASFMGQLRYSVDIVRDPFRIRRLNYEGLWHQVGGWDYLTEENAARSVGCLPDLITYLIGLTERPAALTRKEPRRCDP